MQHRQELLSIFMPVIDLEPSCDSDTKLSEETSVKVYKSINAAFNLEIDLDDAIDAVADILLYDIDDYLDEVERDLGILWNSWTKEDNLVLPFNL